MKEKTLEEILKWLIALNYIVFTVKCIPLKFMICYNCVHIVSFFPIPLPLRKVTQCFDCSDIDRALLLVLEHQKGNKTTPWTKPSENEVTAVHLLLFLSGSVLALSGSVGAALWHGAERQRSLWAAAVWAAPVIPPQGPLCSVTFQSSSLCPGASIRCDCSWRRWCCTCHSSSWPGNSSWFFNILWMSNTHFRHTQWWACGLWESWMCTIKQCFLCYVSINCSFSILPL